MSNFINLGIREEITNKLKEQGIFKPTPIQEQVIPIALNKKDVIAQAQTGTGKTLAFVLPMLELINPQKEQIQALIITPTRELALQITNEVKKVMRPLEGVNALAVYGGQDVERQMKKLKGSKQIVIGTPGRILDHVRRGTIEFSKVSMLVLDEADQMLHMGFLAEVEEIISRIPSRRQTMLFSATMPQQIKALATRYMKNPEDVRVKGTNITLDEIDQLVVETSDRNKQATLFSLIDKYQPYLAMIFCRTKRRAMALNQALLENGYNSDELHGDLSQAKREQVMSLFRQARLQLLVATDVAARGLDVEGVTHVFNYDIPHDAESYIHRIGRTGRAGERGLAITLYAPRDQKYLELIEKGIKGTISRSAGGPLKEKKQDAGRYGKEVKPGDKPKRGPGAKQGAKFNQEPKAAIRAKSTQEPRANKGAKSTQGPKSTQGARGNQGPKFAQGPKSGQGPRAGGKGRAGQKVSRGR